MPGLPSGTVTFVFTDIEGSTPLWEQMPREMEIALAQHHAILRQAIESNGGQVTQIIGDEFQSAFHTAPEALRAALAIQRGLCNATWGATGPIRVRVGLHTGPAEPDPKGDAPYAVSHTLNRAGRVRSTAWGQQILVSQETKDLVERSLPTGVTLKDLGEHHLKGMSIPEHLYQIVTPDLPSDFPPLATSMRHPNNLPPELTSFIGREIEIAALQARFTEPNIRLLTLTGAGGTGKTRLALQLAEAVLEGFPDGAWLVELAPLVDPALVIPTVAQVLGVHGSGSRPLQESLADYLEKKHLLLVLDNCEHLLEECSRLADFLLRRCGKLVILATSREILNVTGETSFRVPSLPVPETTQSLEQVASYGAVRLFVERTRQAAPDFRLEEGNVTAVTTICRRLDGVPLAIELAAARMRVLTAPQIAARLDNVFRLLTGGSRSVLPRQQTLKAAIDWSYALLTAEEKTMLQRLSVFAGSWTLEGAESVCCDREILGSSAGGAIRSGEGIEPDMVLDLLGELVDKSLVQLTQVETGEPRYTMLETVRQYARDRLLESGDGSAGEAVRDRHLDYFLRLGEQAAEELTTVRQLDWLNRLEYDLENFRLALEWALSARIEDGLRFASALMWFWSLHERRSEGAGWLQKLLEAEAAWRAAQPGGSQALTVGKHSISHILVWVRATCAAAYLVERTYQSFTVVQARVMLKESIALCRDIGEPADRELAWALILQGYYRPIHEWGEADHLEALNICERNQDRFLQALGLRYLSFQYWLDLEKKKECLETSLAICESIGETDLTAEVRFALADCLHDTGDHVRCRSLLLQSMAYYRREGNISAWCLTATIMYFFFPEAENAGPAEEALAYMRDHEPESHLLSLMGVCFAEWASGRYERAEGLCHEMLLYTGKVSDSLWAVTYTVCAYVVLARCKVSQGKPDQANPYWMTIASFRLGEEQHIIPGISWALVNALAVYLAAAGRNIAATQIFGGAEDMYQYFLPGWDQRTREEHDAWLAAARSALGEEAFTKAWEEGKALGHWGAFLATIKEAVSNAPQTE